MQERLRYGRIAPEAVRAMLGLELYARRSGLEPSLLNLVKLRASQINGCSYCIDMHTKDARSNGEAERRLYALTAWTETPFFSTRERAALAWTEAVTCIRDDHVPDMVYEQTRRQFTEKELVDLTMAVIAINGWNRLAISFRQVPGKDDPAEELARRNARRGAPADREQISPQGRWAIALGATGASQSGAFTDAPPPAGFHPRSLARAGETKGRS